MGSYEIREYIPSQSGEDFTDLLKAYLTIFNEPENLKFLSFSLQPLERETVRAWFQEHLKQGIHYLAAVEDEGPVIAILVLRVKPATGFELVGLGVHPRAKQTGVGRSLVEEALTLAEDLGFRAVDVGVFADNRVMLRLLLALNFLPVGMKHRVRADGADLVYLKRYL